MVAHYGTAVLPTNPCRPRDNAKVETCVLIVERWLIGRLRDRRFYNLAELNTAIERFAQYARVRARESKASRGMVSR